VDRFLSIPQNLSSTLDAFDLTAAIGTNVNSSNGQISGSQSLPSQLTVFVPTNEAFAAIGSSCTDLSTEDIARLADYHLIPNLVEYSTSFSNGTLTTETQQTLAITVVDGDFYVNNARIEIPNLLTKEGVVHVIDRYAVSLPSTRCFS
jgi:transforming growth factor-beta-induced protein